MATKEETIAEILNGETDLQIRCGVELGYRAGYRAAVEAMEKIDFWWLDIHCRREDGTIKDEGINAANAAIARIRLIPDEIHASLDRLSNRPTAKELAAAIRSLAEKD